MRKSFHKRMIERNSMLIISLRGKRVSFRVTCVDTGKDEDGWPHFYLEDAAEICEFIMSIIKSGRVVTKRALNMNRRTGLGRGGERAISNAYRIGRD